MGLAAETAAQPDGGAIVTLRSRRFAQAVFVDVPGFEPADNHFHIAPGATRRLRLARLDAAAKLRGTALPLNAQQAARITVTPGVEP